MVRGKPSSVTPCCTCNGPAAKCKGCRCAKTDTKCSNCRAPNCGNKIISCPISGTVRSGADQIQIQKDTGETDKTPITLSITDIFEQVVHWKPNLFRLPRCAESKRFIIELARIYRESWSQQESFTKAIVIGHLILQRDIRTSHKTLKVILSRRIDLWLKNEFTSLYTEAYILQEISRRKRPNSTSRDWRRNFTSLVVSGRLNGAMHLLDTDATTGTPLNPDDMIGPTTVRELLLDKHPIAAKLNSNALDWNHVIPPQSFHPVVFDSIDKKLIVCMAKRVTGGAGPSGIDAQSWTHMLSKFGRESDELAEAIASFTRALATERIPMDITQALTSCRLIALTKKTGIRPIGICDVSRRIMTKAILTMVSEDIQQVCGRSQMCAGQRAGVECVTRAIRNELTNNPNHILLSIDADNAFNRINREAALCNIDRICPSLSIVMHNFYDHPSNLSVGGEFVKSQEGFTQGDVLAMPAFAIATLPIIHQISTKFPQVRQLWYADDGNLIGSPIQIRAAYDLLCKIGPAFGFHVNPQKCSIFTPTMEEANTCQQFNGTNVEVRTDGIVILGAPIGVDKYVYEVVESKVDKFCNLVERLADVGILDLQIAYACFTKALQHKWFHTQRTTQCSSDWFAPLRESIRSSSDNIFGLDDSDGSLWPLISLPLHCGGLGIIDPYMSAGVECENSGHLCEPYLNGLQGMELKLEQDFRANEVHTRKKTQYKATLLAQLPTYDIIKRRIIQHTMIKGASSWLSAFPTRESQTRIDNTTFRDAVAARYNTLTKDAPSHCPCGSSTSLAHCLSCPNGGHPSIRHDATRDILAKSLTQICDGVEIEPLLRSVDPSIHFERRSTTTDREARLDISCCGFYGGRSERAFFDICVFNVFAPSNLTRETTPSFEYHEQRKCSKYQERVDIIERANFAPIVYSSLGGESKSASTMIKRLSRKLAVKKESIYAQELTRIREKISLQHARCISMCIRGPRSARNRPANNHTVEW